MSQERGPGELSAEEIADRIGAGSAPQPDQGSPWTLYPPTTVPPTTVPPTTNSPGASPPSSFSPLPRRPIAAVTSATAVAPRIRAEAGSVDRPPDLRSRLVRDTAATLLGLSALGLMVLAVWPSAPDGGVLRATATPAATATPEHTSAPDRSPTPEPSPTPDRSPTSKATSSP